jgi:hypothetical protein
MSFTNILFLAEKRRKQLEFETKVDEKLQQCDCTDDILKYLFLERKKNRDSTLEQLNAPCYKWLSMYDNNISNKNTIPYYMSCKDICRKLHTTQS